MKNENGSQYHVSEYLQKLKYRSSDYSKILKNYITNMRLVALVLIALICMGSIAFLTIPRTLNPEINISVVVVTTVMPGATPTDMESLVTKKIEKELAKIDNVDIITSTSRESMSNIVIQFDDGTKRDSAQTDVQNAIGTLSTLPSEAHSPQIKAIDFEDVPVMRYAIVGNDIDEASLNSFVDSFIEDLEDQELIDRVVVSGNESQEVQILIKQERLNELNVDLQTVASLIKGALSSYPSGKVQSDTTEIGLTIDRDAMTIDELRNIIIAINGVMYRLGDIAQIAERSEPGHIPAFITSTQGLENNAITFDVYRIVGSKIADVNDQTVAIMESYQEIVDDSISFVKITSVNDDIEESFSDLYRNLSITVLLVFLVLFLFIGMRQAFLAALSIPLVFMTAFVVMMITGMTLNFLSIFALLLSLGLLVDVTIVIISAITTYYRSGKFTPKEVGLLVWKDYFGTLLVTTLTTVWAFIPLLLSTGIVGEFIKPLPIVVSSVLIGSVLVGFFIILPLMVWLLDFSMPRRTHIFFSIIIFVLFLVIVQQLLQNIGMSIPPLMWIAIVPTIIMLGYFLFVIIKKAWQHVKEFFQKRSNNSNKTNVHYAKDGIINLSRLMLFYQRTLDSVLQKKNSRLAVIGMVIVFFIFSISLVGFGFVKSEFFPSNDQTIVYVSMELPLDTRANISEDVAREFVAQIFDIDGILNIQTQIGAKITGDGDVLIGVNPNNVLITINLVDEELRDITSIEIAQDLRSSDAVRQFNEGKIIVSELSSGPPAGADVTIKLMGDDLDQLNIYANQVSDFLENTNGVINVKKSVETGSGKISFIPDSNQLIEHGFSVQEIGMYLRTFGSGLIVSEDVDFDDLSDSRDIAIRLSDDIQSIDALERTSVIARNGVSVPLTTLGKFVFKESPTEINREDLKRVLTVTAAVEDGYDANKINQETGNYIDDEIILAHGYSWQTGGANEESQKSVNSILKAMVLAIMLIFLTLIIQFGSYRKSFIVLLVIPLAISGVFVLFAIFGIPLSFPALIGLLALFGIVINNSIMIIDQINKNHKENLPFHQAVVEGSSSRFEPILLSSLTTIVGLLPTTITQPVWQGLGGAIISGLVFSGVIMLFFIPAVYYMMFEKECT